MSMIILVFLMASPKVFSCTEAGKVQPDRENVPSHDSINRLLYRLPSDTEVLWHEAARFTDMSRGVLISDDSVWISRMQRKYRQLIIIGQAGITAL